MKIKHTKVSCGPDGSFHPGAVRDTDSPGDNLTMESARQLVAGGYAEDVTPSAATPSQDVVADAAAAEAAAFANPAELAAAPEAPVVLQPQPGRKPRKAT